MYLSLNSLNKKKIINRFVYQVYKHAIDSGHWDWNNEKYLGQKRKGKNTKITKLGKYKVKGEEMEWKVLYISLDLYNRPIGYCFSGFSSFIIISSGFLNSVRTWGVLLNARVVRDFWTPRVWTFRGIFSTRNLKGFFKAYKFLAKDPSPFFYNNYNIKS